MLKQNTTKPQDEKSLSLLHSSIYMMFGNISHHKLLTKPDQVKLLGCWAAFKTLPPPYLSSFGNRGAASDNFSNFSKVTIQRARPLQAVIGQVCVGVKVGRFWTTPFYV